MKICKNCGQAVKDDENFCHNCGFDLRLTSNSSPTNTNQNTSILSGDRHTEDGVQDQVAEAIPTYVKSSNPVTETSREFVKLAERLLDVLAKTFDMAPFSGKDLAQKYSRMRVRLSGKLAGYDADKISNRVEPLLSAPARADSEDIVTLKQLTKRYEHYFTPSALEAKLATLSGQSSNAIVDTENISDLQNYLHVDRTELQNQLIMALQEMQKNSGRLIFVVGNVGDGKSHLLGYLKEQHPDLFEDVYIHYDATESFDPQKTAMDTLIDVLKPFSDENMATNHKNLVVAINMGILVNFVRTIEHQQNFTQLRTYLQQTKILDSTSHTEPIFNKHIDLVAFRDYPLFTVDASGSKSDFYDELFEKIVNQSKTNNPFYKAYCEDKENYISSITHYNYELFTNPNVRETLKYLLIKIQLESKAIISTRAILEMIHDTLMPVAGLSEHQLVNYEGLLPNLLFGGKGDSVMIKKIQKFDPLGIQNEQTETFGTKIYETNKSLADWADSFFGADADSLKWLWDLIPAQKPEDQTETEFVQNNIGILLRLKYLMQHTDGMFADSNYEHFLTLLSMTKSEDFKNPEMNNFARMVREFIFTWNGSYHNQKYIFTYINETQKFGIAVPISLQYVGVRADDFNLVISFKNKDMQGKEYQLTIDFELFELICKVNQGYLLKSEDKRQFVNVASFVEGLSKSNQALSTTIIGNIATGEFYELSDDGIGFVLEEVK